MRDTPDVIARPPLLYIGALALGLAIDWASPAPFLPQTLQYIAGAALIVLAGALAGWAFARFIRAGTNIPTNRPTTALVTAGPYRFSRNPIYAALTLLYLGIALAVDSVWIAALIVPVLITIRYGVIAREEIFLERKFSDAYREYKARVRRWL
jgi:protein-S-isoprenylcysteine O-methyltransferase Ste14